jgi:hypothetical protein
LCELRKSQELEKVHKALSLNGDTSSVYNQNLGVLSVSAIARKPTLWIKRAAHNHSPNNIKLRFASSIKSPEELTREREKADKAMSLNYGF